MTPAEGAVSLPPTTSHTVSDADDTPEKPPMPPGSDGTVWFVQVSPPSVVARMNPNSSLTVTHVSADTHEMASSPDTPIGSVRSVGSCESHAVPLSVLPTIAGAYSVV